MKCLRQLIALSIIFEVVFCSLLIQFANAQGTSTNFQGPKGTFYGIKWANQRWGGDSNNIAGSLHDFNTILKFDPDGAESGKPNVYGEMTSIYLPSNTLGNINPWLPSSWLNQLQYSQNPIGNYTWPVGDKYYGMQAWLCRWYLAFSAEWQGGMNILSSYGEVPIVTSPILYSNENNFEDLEVWLQIDTRPTFYYQNAEATYFGIGKIQLSNDVNYRGTTTQTGGLLFTNTVEPRTTVSLSPESAPSLLYMYDNPWGTVGTQQRDASVYQGQALSQAVFKDVQYVKLSFNKFGIYAGSTIPETTIGGWVRGDVAVVCLDVVVFSIGQWQVQDVQNDPANYGRFVRQDTVDLDILTWLLSPQTLGWLIPVIIFIGLLIFAPWVIIAIIGALR